MVRPLKKRKEDGTTYSRRPEVEKSIAQALGEDPATLPARAALTDARSSGYLAPEALVHLIRNALRTQNYSASDAMIACLGKRCASTLQRRVQETKAFSATDVREEAISSLYELFAEDVLNPTDALLDYYEVNFNGAFAALRVGIIRKALAQRARVESLDQAPPGDEDADPPEFEDLSTNSDVVLCAQNAELHRMIQSLPQHEREAVVWKYVYGFKTESNDPAEMTLASLCGVSGSEIRSRLRAAYARLKKRMEEKS